MATLHNPKLEMTIVLRSHHTFGRRRSSVDTWLQSPDVSHIHAAIRWESAYWVILDLSRNGTRVDDQHLTYGKNTTLQAGMTIKFGDSAAATWQVLDVDAPKTVLIPLHEEQPPIELDTLYSLPDEQNPEISLYIAEHGQWLCERPDGVTPLYDGDVISHRQKLWKFYCAEAIETTPAQLDGPRESTDAITFRFDVSLDEEHIFLKLIRDNTTFDLGERAHHYLLLTLARRRLDDMQNQVDPNEQGWIDLEDLSQLLDLDPPHLNIQIFRARKQIAKLELQLSCLPQVVERRVGSVRFGCPLFTIMRGSEVEGVSLHVTGAPGPLWRH